MDLEAVLARFDRTSPETLLSSIAGELVRLHQSHATMLSRVAAMEALQATIDRIAADTPEMLAVELPESVEIDARSSLSGAQGFYELEYGESGKPYRWTGPAPQFWFDFFVNREKLVQFVLQFGHLYGDEPPTLIRCYADGKETSAELIQTRDGFQLRGLLPPRADRGASVLSFVCPVMLSPLEAGVAADIRRLGVTFESLKIDPLPADEAALLTQSASTIATKAGLGAAPMAGPPTSTGAKSDTQGASTTEATPALGSEPVGMAAAPPDITAAFMSLSETHRAEPASGGRRRPAPRAEPTSPRAHTDSGAV